MNTLKALETVDYEKVVTIFRHILHLNHKFVILQWTSVAAQNKLVVQGYYLFLFFVK